MVVKDDDQTWYEYLKCQESLPVQYRVGLKQAAFGLVEEVFGVEPEPVTVDTPVPGTDIIVKPFPEKVLKIFSQRAAAMRVYRNEHSYTTFGSIVPEEEVFSFAEGLIAEISNHEVNEIEVASLSAWDLGKPRGLVDPRMVLVRAVLRDPNWYPPYIKRVAMHPVPDGYKPRVIPRPIIDYVCKRNDNSRNFWRRFRKAVDRLFDNIRLVPDASVGFWKLGRMVDSRRTKSQQEDFILRLKLKAIKWIIRAMNAKSDDAIRQVSPPVATGIRAQGGGRIIYLASKIVALWMMYMSQAYHDLMASISPYYYYCGDRDHQRRMLLRVIRGKPGIATFKGDDFTGKVGNKVVSGDTSAHDMSVYQKERNAWIAKMMESLDVWYGRLYRTIHVGLSTDSALSVGMLHRTSEKMHATMSGCPDTGEMNTDIQFTRWRTAGSLVGFTDSADVISALGKMAWYRPEKQFIHDNTATICQLIVSTDAPGKIYGLISRTLRSLVEYEGVRLHKDENPKPHLIRWDRDLRVLQVCANAYGHPKWKDMMNFVVKHWDIRTPKPLLLDMYASWLRGKRRRAGKVEREALTRTLEYLFPK